MSKQKNVQQQNIGQKQKIYNEAKYWREHGIAKVISEFLATHNIKADTAILLDYICDNGYGTDEGMIVTTDGKFYVFDMQLNTERTEITTIHLFEDITETIEINEHKKGTGKTLGYLALEVVKEINHDI